MKLIQTKDCLLLIDEKAEIKKKDWYYHTKYNHICQCRAEPNISMVEAGCKKIIAYYPLTKEAKELDLPLLPEHDIEGFRIIQYRQFSLEDIQKAFGSGYNSAKNYSYKRNGTYREDFNRFIQSLSTQQFPKEFIPEYYTNGDMIIKNRNGIRELVGTYKY